MERILILTVGFPYSGKSTWARRHGKVPIVCPDAIRLATHGQRFASEAEELVWAMAKIMVRSLFLAGHNTVIVDACHTSALRRDFWKDPQWVRRYLVCDVSAEVCRARAREEGDSIILPSINRMEAKFDLDGVFYGTLNTEIPMKDVIQLGAEQLYHESNAGDDKDPD